MENRRRNCGNNTRSLKFPTGMRLRRGPYLPTCSQCSCSVGRVGSFPALPHNV